MSGAWTGWVRRLRKDQQGGEESESDTGPHEREPATDQAVLQPGAQEFEHDLPASPQASGDLVARQMLSRGALEQARATLQAGEDVADPPTKALANSIREGEAQLRRCGTTQKGRGDDVLRGIMLAPCRGANQLVVVFGDDQGSFFLPRAADLNRRPHLLFVQDPASCLSLLGVPRLGETYDDCLLAILRLSEGLEAPDLFCIGGGPGMYSAMRYGLDLGASGVLAVGTLTDLGAGPAPGDRSAEDSGRLAAEAGMLGADLARAYASAAQRPGLVLCWPKGEVRPPASLAALSGVVLSHAPARAQAQPLAWADQTGRLRGMVRELLGHQPIFKPGSA